MPPGQIVPERTLIVAARGAQDARERAFAGMIAAQHRGERGFQFDHRLQARHGFDAHAGSRQRALSQGRASSSRRSISVASTLMP
jgi:hypothetical protein